MEYCKNLLSYHKVISSFLEIQIANFVYKFRLNKPLQKEKIIEKVPNSTNYGMSNKSSFSKLVVKSYQGRYCRLRSDQSRIPRHLNPFPPRSKRFLSRSSYPLQKWIHNIIENVITSELIRVL